MKIAKTSMDQDKKLKLFGQFSGGQEERLKQSPIQASCIFDINIQNVETAEYLPDNQLKFSIQIRGDYLIEVDISSQNILSALKLNFNLKFETGQRENQVQEKLSIQQKSIRKSYILKVTNLINNHDFKEQKKQSQYGEHKQVELISADQISFKKFITVLFAKPIMQEVQDLKHLFKPGKLIKTAKTCKIYQALCIKTKQKFIIKAYPKQFLNERNLLPFVIKQLNCIQQFSQPGVVKIKKVYCTEKTIYVILPQYHFNLSTFNKIYDSKITNIQAVLKTVMQVLSNLHDQKIVHRNINSDHILVNEKNGRLTQIALTGFDNCLYFEKIPYQTYQEPQLMIEENQNNKFEQACAADIQMVGNILFKMIAKDGQEQQSANSGNILSSKSIAKDLFIHKDIPTNVLDLLSKMIQTDPKARIKSRQTLDHNFFKENYSIQQDINNIQSFIH